jgi:hypothetical protein
MIIPMIGILTSQGSIWIIAGIKKASYPCCLFTWFRPNKRLSDVNTHFEIQSNDSDFSKKLWRIQNIEDYSFRFFALYFEDI